MSEIRVSGFPKICEIRNLRISFLKVSSFVACHWLLILWYFLLLLLLLLFWLLMMFVVVVVLVVVVFVACCVFGVWCVLFVFCCWLFVVVVVCCLLVCFLLLETLSATSRVAASSLRLRKWHSGLLRLPSEPQSQTNFLSVPRSILHYSRSNPFCSPEPFSKKMRACSHSQACSLTLRCQRQPGTRCG